MITPKKGQKAKFKWNGSLSLAIAVGNRRLLLNDPEAVHGFCQIPNSLSPTKWEIRLAIIFWHLSQH